MPHQEHDFTTFDPLQLPCPLKFPTAKISKFYLFVVACFINHVITLFFVDANCGNLLLMGGRDPESIVIAVMTGEWRTIGYFSATASLVTLL